MTTANPGVSFSRAGSLAAAAAGVGHPHRVPAGLLRQGQAAGDGAEGGGVGDAEEVAEDLLGGVLARPDDGEQELVGGVEVEGVAAAEGAAAVGPVEAAAAVGVEGLQQTGEHGVEGGDGQARQGPEDGVFCLSRIWKNAPFGLA